MECSPCYTFPNILLIQNATGHEVELIRYQLCSTISSFGSLFSRCCSMCMMLVCLVEGRWQYVGVLLVNKNKYVNSEVKISDAKLGQTNSSFILAVVFKCVCLPWLCSEKTTCVRASIFNLSISRNQACRLPGLDFNGSYESGSSVNLPVWLLSSLQESCRVPCSTNGICFWEDGLIFRTKAAQAPLWSIIWFCYAHEALCSMCIEATSMLVDAAGIVYKCISISSSTIDISNMSLPTAWASLRIYPPIGFARVGNSTLDDGWFYGPEVPGYFEEPQNGFKDINGAVKRQVSLKTIALDSMFTSS